LWKSPALILFGMAVSIWFSTYFSVVAVALGPASAVQAAVVTVLNGAVGFEADSMLENNPHDPYIFGFRSEERNPIFVRVIVRRDQVEQLDGRYNWQAVRQLLQRYQDETYEPVFVLGSDSPPQTPEEIRGWLRFVRQLAREFKKDCHYFEMWETPNLQPCWQHSDGVKAYSYFLKKSSVELKAILPQATVVSGGVAGPDLQWLSMLCELDISPYVEVIPIQPGVENVLEAERAAKETLLLLESHGVTCRVWQNRVPLEGGNLAEARAEFLRVALENAFSGVALTTFEMKMDREERQTLFKNFTAYQALFTRDLAPIPPGQELFELRDPQGRSLLGSQTRLLPFFGAVGFRTFVVFFRDEIGDPQPAELLLGVGDLNQPLIHDLSKKEKTPASFTVDEGNDPRGATVFVNLSSRPMILDYGRDSLAGAGAPSFVVDVTGTKQLTVEEILTRHQAFQASQDARLDHFSAQGEVSIFINLAEFNNTFDVTTSNNFYYDRITGMEWEQKEHYINGVKWRSGKFPKIPLVQPEKVPVIPLEISLDREYQYTLLGEELVGEFHCYLLKFQPVSEDSPRFSGKVWLDKVSFAKVKITSVQTNLQDPVISNDQTDFYLPHTAADGELWLLDHIDGQQVFSTSGRNTAVERKITFRNYQVNSPEFNDLRQQAYDSGHNILRDTDEGMRYLEQGKDGEMKVVDNLYQKVLAGATGVYIDPGLKNTLPLLGVDYFDFNFLNTKSQLNVFFAGMLLDANLTKTDLAGTGMELGMELFGIGIPLKSRVFRREDGGEAPGEELESLPMSLGVNLGYNMANFWKVRLSYYLGYRHFSDSSDTADDFIVPVSTRTDNFSLGLVYQKRGYSLNLSTTYGRRAKWEFWGRPEGQDLDPQQQDFTLFSGVLAKDFHLPFFQKIHLELGYFGGNDLDRFSKYSFGPYGDTALHGYSSGTLRADRAAIAHLGYGFNLGQVIRFGAFLDGAYYRDDDLLDDFETLLGTGISTGFIGPWQTIVRLDYGYGFNGIDDSGEEGTQILSLVILKIF